MKNFDLFDKVALTAIGTIAVTGATLVCHTLIPMLVTVFVTSNLS